MKTLFIGGEADREVHEIPWNETLWRIAHKEHAVMSMSDSKSIETTLYQKVKFACEDKTWEVFVPAHKSAAYAMQKLMDFYSK